MISTLSKRDQKERISGVPMPFAPQNGSMTVRERIYADYFAPSRLVEYRRLLERALTAGFDHCTVYELYTALSRPNPELNDKIFVHRHDIDTDCATARQFFEVEKQLGVKASYYFRLNTLDVRLMSEIHEYGSEVGYHYEEIATYAKRSGLRSGKDVLEHIGAIRHEFERNFLAVEKRLGFKVRTVASHGDFANRAMRLSNAVILEDKALRERLSIECESYDDILMSFFDAYLSDAPPREYWRRGSPLEAVNTKRKICLLTHPRHWRTNILVNTLDNLTRLIEEFLWRRH